MRGCRMLHSLFRSKRFPQPSALESLRCPVRSCRRPAESSLMHAGKVAVLTASTQGIGLSTARRLAQQGANVVLSSRKQENVNKALEQLKAENLNVSGIVCDAGNKEDRERLMELALEKYGGIDYLFSNASLELTPKDFMDTTDEEWDQIFSLNVKAMFMLVKQVLPHMKKRGGGSIVLTSSVVGFNGVPTIGAYSVSKSAVNGLTKVLSGVLSPMNIRVNSLAPGLLRTEYTSFLWENEEVLKKMMLVYGFNRVGEAEECAGMVSFLLSPDASYVTGEIIAVGGGFKTRI